MLEQFLVKEVIVVSKIRILITLVALSALFLVAPPSTISQAAQKTPKIIKVVPRVKTIFVRWQAQASRVQTRLQMRTNSRKWKTIPTSPLARKTVVKNLNAKNFYRFRIGSYKNNTWVYSKATQKYTLLKESDNDTTDPDNTNDETPPNDNPPDNNPPVDNNPGTEDPSPGSGGGDWVPPTVPQGTVFWVDPSVGNDDNAGTQGAPLATITEAWNRIPSNTRLTTSYRILLRAGEYSAGIMPNYWENRRGTAAAPITLEAIDGARTVTLRGDINMANVQHFWLKNVDIIRNGDAFHCELCSYTTISGGVISGGGGAHETIKVNQSDHIDIVNSDISGADENAIDFVAVVYGTISGNKIHEAVDWCAYAKGGSSYINVTKNEIYDCGTGGFTAGQGTGYEFMVYPWIKYEAYGITIMDNIIHDTEGAGLGVNGGYNILMAFNTLYRVGTRSHLVEFVHGSRSCDGDVYKCSSNRELGGWGTTDEGGQWIPSKHVYFVNNVIYNPAGVESRWQHFTVANPVTPPSVSGVPSPSRADDDLRIWGNIIWNGSSSMETGVSNPTLLLENNRINTLEPDLRNPSQGDYRPVEMGQLAGIVPQEIPAFSWSDIDVSAGDSSTIVMSRPPGALR